MYIQPLLLQVVTVEEELVVLLIRQPLLLQLLLLEEVTEEESLVVFLHRQPFLLQPLLLQTVTVEEATMVLGLRKKPKDLSASESEDRGHGEGRDVYDTVMEGKDVCTTLLQSDTIQSYGRPKVDTRPVGVGLLKKGPE